MVTDDLRERIVLHPRKLVVGAIEKTQGLSLAMALPAVWPRATAPASRGHHGRSLPRSRNVSYSSRWRRVNCSGIRTPMRR